MANIINNSRNADAEPQAPFVTNKNVLLTNGTPVTINVLANAFDPDHLTLTVASVTHPSLGRAVINSDNTVTYIPNESFAKYSGTDSFRYTVTNGAASATGLVTIGNAFYPQKGSFAGVNGGGYLTLTTTNTGAFTGKFRTGNVVYSLKGQFDANGMFMVSINGELLVLQMDVTDLSGGAYGNDTIPAAFITVSASLLITPCTIPRPTPPRRPVTTPCSSRPMTRPTPPCRRYRLRYDERCRRAARSLSRAFWPMGRASATAATSPVTGRTM